MKKLLLLTLCCLATQTYGALPRLRTALGNLGTHIKLSQNYLLYALTPFTKKNNALTNAITHLSPNVGKIRKAWTDFTCARAVRNLETVTCHANSEIEKKETQRSIFSYMENYFAWGYQMPMEFRHYITYKIDKSQMKKWSQTQLMQPDIFLKASNYISYLLEFSDLDFSKTWAHSFLQQHYSDLTVDELVHAYDYLDVEDFKFWIQKILTRPPEAFSHTNIKNLLEQVKQKGDTLLLQKLFTMIQAKIGLEKFITEQNNKPCFNKRFFDNHQSHWSFNYCYHHHAPTLISKLAPIFGDVQREYEKGNIVFFHGRHSNWDFLETVYRKLFEKKEKTQVTDFIFLSILEGPALEDNERKYLTEKGVVTETDHAKYRKQLLFVTLNLLANHSGSNALIYAHHNYNTSTQKQNAEKLLTQKLITIFKNFGITLSLRQITQLLFLHKQYYSVIKKAGNHGTLIVISMPPSVASLYSFSCSSGGKQKKHFIDGKETSDPVLLAHNYYALPFNNECAITKSAQPFLDPALAAHNGITIKAYNPVYDMAEYKQFESQLNTFITELDF